MKIETQTAITIDLDGTTHTLTRSEAEDLYYKLKKELGITDTQIWPNIPQNPMPNFPEWPPQTPIYPSYPQVWCATQDNNFK
jgi:hypothetical protein